MDQLSIHPYPNPNSPTDSPDVGYAATNNYGVPNLDRVKQAIYDAFNGTGQPTTVNGLTFRIDELGWQTDTTAYPQYYNQENVRVVSEQQQAAFLQETAEKYFACDPTVTDVELFLLVDEPPATAGARTAAPCSAAAGRAASSPPAARASRSRSPRTRPLASDFAAGRGACKGAPISWAPAGSRSGTSQADEEEADRRQGFRQGLGQGLPLEHRQEAGKG